MPLLIFSKIVIKIKRKEKYEFYSYVVFGYKDKYFFWDFILMLQKFLIIFATTFIANFNNLVILLNFMNFAFFYLQVSVRPYRNKRLNKISFYSNSCIFFINLAGFVLNKARFQVLNLVFVAFFTIRELYFPFPLDQSHFEICERDYYKYSSKTALTKVVIERSSKKRRAN